MIDWVSSLPVPGIVVRKSPPKALTPEWFKARRGRITASTRAQIIEEASPRAWLSLNDELRYEISPEWQHKPFKNMAMQWGNDHEAEALDAISRTFGCRLIEPGLVLHPEYDYAGATPDGYIVDDVTIQVKCPFLSKNHMKTILDSQMSATYYAQVQWEAWISGKKKIIYASYDPRVPADMRLCMIDVPLDEDMHKTFEINLARFKTMFELQKFSTPGKLVVHSGIPDVFH
jgi:putative phage-type endonuclease